MNIALLGYGDVGQCLVENLSSRREFSIQRILTTYRIPLLGDRVTPRLSDILNDPAIAVVVNLIDDPDAAYESTIAALEAGKHVVSLNAEMFARHMEPLVSAARKNRVHLLCDGCVGNGIPYLYNLVRIAQADTIRSVFGIANGVANLVLDAMQSTGVDLRDVLGQIQRGDSAVLNPQAAIDGLDSRAKLCLFASIAFGLFIPEQDIALVGIGNISRDDMQVFQRLGYVCRLLARAEQVDGTRVTAYVEPTLISATEPEATVRRSNLVFGFVSHYLGRHSFFGADAGKESIAKSIEFNLLDILHSSLTLPEYLPQGHAVIDNSLTAHRYYVRTASRLSIPAERLRGGHGQNFYLTAPIPVDRMHALAASLRMRDPNLFFAGIRG